MSSLSIRPLPRRARYALAAAITAILLSLVGQPPSRAANAPPAAHATAAAIGR